MAKAVPKVEVSDEEVTAPVVTEEVTAPVVTEEVTAPVVTEEVTQPPTDAIVPGGLPSESYTLSFEEVITYLISDIQKDDSVPLRSQIAVKLEEALSLLRVK